MKYFYDLFRQGRVDTDGLITHRFTFSDYKEAIRVAGSKGRQQAIKVMLQVD
jgi:threonine dehydrogenase-like Zn-dependent dehydrogenase